MSSGWYAIDLDGTLAKYGDWEGELSIGDPIPLMVKRVRKWLEEDKDVRIFTARVAHRELRDKIVKAIQDWCEENVQEGWRPVVTNKKDYSMIELWDDRAVQVEPNTGKRVDGK